MSLSEQVFKLKSLLDTVESEVKSFEGGKKAAAARGRKTLQDVKKSSHELRKSIIERLKEMKVKQEPKMKEEPKVKEEPKPVEVKKPVEVSPKVRKPRAKKAKVSIA